MDNQKMIQKHKKLDLNVQIVLIYIKSKKQIPEFLISMYEKSIHNFTEEQSITFAKFLINYQDVFSKDDLDMGLFNGDIEHKINKG